jgi:hypothetical protein
VDLPEERPPPKPTRDVSGNAANGAVERFMTVLNLGGFDQCVDVPVKRVNVADAW